MTAAVFFHADAAALSVGGVAVLDGDEGRHAADVRRLRVGEVVDLTDGAGTLVHGSITAVRRGVLDVQVTAQTRPPRGRPSYTVVQALARGGRDEAAVESMTEVGVDEVIGWEAQRSIARWTDRSESRWSVTVRSAAKQSRRAWWPTVSGPAALADVATCCRAADLAVVLHSTADLSLVGLPVPTEGQVVLVVGPEGGITDDELAILAGSGAVVARIGDGVLRSSTAGVVALSVLLAATRWRPGAQ